MTRLYNLPPYILCLLSAVLLWLGWPPFYTNILVFAGFVPMFALADKFSGEEKGARKFLLHVFLSMSLWNALTTWWIWNASPGGAVFSFFFNGSLMSVPWLVYFVSLKYFRKLFAQTIFVCAWIAYEHLHINWQLAWPWLNLGNAFATLPQLVQWYEYTGAEGGTLWVLLVNILLYDLLAGFRARKALRLALGLVMPMLISAVIYMGREPLTSDKGVSVTIVQPNVDPYEEKFDRSTFHAQMERMQQLAREHSDKETQLIIFPETAISKPVNERDFLGDEGVQILKTLTGDHCSVLTGADTYRFFVEGEKLSETARAYEGGLFYDSYNTALMFDPSDSVQVFHKNKLVPGVESLPFPTFTKPLERLFDLGGTSGSLGSDKYPKVFKMNNGTGVLPVICYESVFGDWVRKGVKDGADIIAVITNDGWWKNTPGYKQHLHYARLRAIENRRFVLRSANTGISAIINMRGDIVQHTSWWVPAALKGEIHTSDEETFYLRQGDYIGRIAMFTGLLLLATGVFYKKTRRSKV